MTLSENSSIIFEQYGIYSEVYFKKISEAKTDTLNLFADPLFSSKLSTTNKTYKETVLQVLNNHKINIGDIVYIGLQSNGIADRMVAVKKDGSDFTAIIQSGY